MKKKAITCLVLTVLFLVSAFFSIILSTAIESTCASEVSADPSETDDWPMFHHNMANTGNSKSTAPKTNQTLWKFNTGGPVDSPVVSDGVVYFGSLDNNVYALNATTGARKWSYTTDGNVLSPAAIAEGMVYVGSLDAKVYALNATTGAYIWSYKTGDDVVSTPAVADGKVYIGSNDNNLYAFNAFTGDVVWNYTTGNQIHLSSPAVADGVVYVGSNDHNVYALNASDGSLVWKYPTGDVVISSPAIVNGIVYIGSYDDNIYALNASTGALIWNYTTGGDVASSPAVADGVVFVGSYDKKMYALNATSGALLWSYITLDKVVSSPAVSDGAIYFGSYDHLVYAIGASSSSPQTYGVSFIASGLPQGTSWTVTFNGQTKNSTSDAIVFNVPNGVYSFSITSPDDHTAFPSSGTVTANATNVYQQITFTSTIQDFPWLLVVALSVGAVLLALAITAFVLYRRKH